MRTVFRLIIIVFLSAMLQEASAQNKYSTSSPKAAAYFDEALKFYNQSNNVKAIQKLKDAIAIDTAFVEAYVGLSEIYREMGATDKVEEYLKKGIKINPSVFPGMYYNLADLYYGKGMYAEALKNFTLYLGMKNSNQKLRKNAEKKSVNCRFAINAIKHPVPFNPVNLGDSVNSIYEEYWPSLSADEKTLVITRKVPVRRIIEPGVEQQEDFYVSTFQNNHWTKAEDAGFTLNTPANEGAQSLSADGQVMFYTACDRRDGYGRCDIYVSVKRQNQWSQPVNVGPPINTAYSEKQPSISPDGKSLYFVCNKPGGKGGFDIYMAQLDSAGYWLDPVNLGDSINTSDDEQSPFIAMDNQTLYFSSRGWPGMGGFDLFVSHRKPDGTWSTPRNLGYPINTAGDEIGMIVNARGNKAYFASNREGSQGLDIYDFDLYKEARPIPVSYMKGIVFDAETGKKLSARLELIDLATGKIINQAVSSSSTGAFFVTIPSERDYALNISKDGYLFYSDNFALKGVHDAENPYLKDVPLKPIQVGESVILKNIFFDTDSYQLKAESRTELNKLLEFLKKNPAVKIEISGHTDNVGTEQHNQTLSEQRANEVKSYLTRAGISTDRIAAKGYGESKPVASNENESGRALNRRTEFSITAR